MAPAEKVRMLEQCRVAPPPGTVADKSLPLTFFDIPWLHFPLIHHIIFHDYPHCNAHFLGTTVPVLKRSLSLALKHYFPFSGNVVLPSDSSKPLICYVSGDSALLTVAESASDFNHLTGNHLRDADEFYPLVPKLPPVSESAGTIRAPILAVQLTLFPNSGICIGFTFRRVVADGNACTGFIRSFASITKRGGDEAVLSGRLVPFCERSAVEEKDPNGLDHLFWTQVGKRKFDGSQPEYVPTNKVRATFILGQDHVNGLKKWVTSQRPTMSHVSTFTVSCAYVWTCLIKSRAASGKAVGEDEEDHFVFGADCRSILDPPVPETYFGNCLVNCYAKVKTAQLVHEEGLLAAAEAIGGAIFGKLRSGVGVLEGAEKWVSDFRALKQDRIVGVSGSPGSQYTIWISGGESPKRVKWYP